MATNSGIRRTFFNAFGQPVASLSGRTLRKKVRASRHLLRQPPAWAIDLQILEAAKQDGAEWVEIADVESHKVYLAPLVAFFLHGIRIDRGFGPQIALPLAHWHVEALGAQQLCLFGETE
jgi:hypothetical protein